MKNHCEEEQGSIEVICGSMYSGKSEELIRRIKRALIARLRVIAFKPSIDTRYHKEHIVSHDQNKIEAHIIENVDDILSLSSKIDIIGIDEVQFFDQRIVSIIQKLADVGKRVLVAGLDMDYRGIPFTPMPTLLAIADHVSKLHAICSVCGKKALYTYRKTKEKSLIEIGAFRQYEARCRLHFKTRFNN